MPTVPQRSRAVLSNEEFGLMKEAVANAPSCSNPGVISGRGSPTAIS